MQVRMAFLVHLEDLIDTSKEKVSAIRNLRETPEEFLVHVDLS